MPDVPITLVPWFDAKDNPPEEKARVYPTNLGLLYLRAFASKVEWVELDAEGYAYVQHPRVYCEDPSPPDMSDPLTADDLRRVLQMARWYTQGVLVVGGPSADETLAMARFGAALATIEGEGR